MPLQAWIVDYVTDHFGKQDGAEPHWDKDKQRWVQIIGRIHNKSKSKNSKLNTTLRLIVSDSTTQIECKIIPELVSLHGHQSFEINNIINLQTFDLRIAASFKNIYFILMECSFLTALNVADIGKHKKNVPNINSNKNIHRSINKYRICQHIQFTLKDGEHSFDENNLPQSLHSAQQMNSFGFDNEINSLKQSFNENMNEFQQINNINEYEISELCLEQMDINTEDIDEDMIQDENKNKNISQNIEINVENNKQKKSSDKEEMEEGEEEEKQIIEIGKDKKNKKGVKYIGNLCDWIHNLYPNFSDIPKELKVKANEIERPIHTPAKGYKNKKRKEGPVMNELPAKRQRVEQQQQQQQEEQQNYSQISLTSSEIMQCDEMVKEKQKKKENEFVKPIYSLTERIKNNNTNNNNNINDSIISVQESINSNENINEMNDLLDEMDVEIEENNNNMNEPIDMNNLGNITRNDLIRICKYFVKKSNEMNRNNNNDSNNPFYVKEFDK